MCVCLLPCGKHCTNHWRCYGGEKKKGKAHVVLILMKFSLVENININWMKNIIVVFLRLQNSQKFLV